MYTIYYNIYRERDLIVKTKKSRPSTHTVRLPSSYYVVSCSVHTRAVRVRRRGRPCGRRGWRRLYRKHWWEPKKIVIPQDAYYRPNFPFVRENIPQPSDWCSYYVFNTRHDAIIKFVVSECTCLCARVCI